MSIKQYRKPIITLLLCIILDKWLADSSPFKRLAFGPLIVNELSKKKYVEK